jgi:hypothetical protein
MGLKSEAYRTPTLRSYEFRFTNITNSDRDLDALPGLRKIFEMLDLENILRLTTPNDRLELAYDISAEIIRNIVKEEEEEEKSGSGSPSDTGEESESDEDGEGQSGSDVPGDMETDPLGGSDESEFETPSQADEHQKNEGEAGTDSGDLTDKQMHDLDKSINDQKDVINREIKQKTLSEDVLKKLKSLETSGTSLAQVGGEMGIPKIDCIVVNKMTKELMDSETFPYKSYLKSLPNKHAASGVEEGIVMGAMLGRKLQIRSEARTTRFNRLNKGKFDRRFIADLGFAADNVFYRTETNKHNDVHMHISVDASSSMDTKWKATMKTVVAMAKAGSMVNNLHVVISFRSGIITGSKNVFDKNQVPYIIIAYDSKVDKFSKIQQLFPHVSPNGSTPEGLTFQAILGTLPPSQNNVDSYFVNISDGEPMFSNCYFGDVAQSHTKKQIDKIRSNGINVLSYFVESAMRTSDGSQTAFRKMYGRDAQLIDVNSVVEIAKTMNKKFLENDK